MTIKQAIKITIDNLNGISVPRWLNEQIGIPIDNAVQNLIYIVEAIERDEKAQQERDGDANGETDT